jgi:hypothetical protein
MNVRTISRPLLALCCLAPVAITPVAAANIVDYAKSAISEAYLAEPRRRGISLAFAGATPPGDRIAVSFAITPFTWVTNTPYRVADVADADLVIVHLRSFKQLAAATALDPRIAPVVQKHAAQLQQAGACTKITETRAGGVKRGFVFLSLEDNEDLRKSCLYGHVRALFGLREDGEAGEFADAFLADLAIARCISRVRPPAQAAPSEAKAAIVQALAAGACAPR